MGRATERSSILRCCVARLAVASVACIALVGMPAYAGVFYKFRVVAETGVGGLTGFGKGPSINSRGNVGFIGQVGTNQSVYFGSGTAAAVDIAAGGVTVLGDGTQINDGNEIVTQERRTTVGGILTEIKVHRPPSGTAGVIARGNDLESFDSLFPFPTINNTRTLEDIAAGTGNFDGACDSGETCLPQVVFGGFHSASATRTLVEPLKLPANPADLGSYKEFGFNSTIAKPMLADTGRVIVRGRNPGDPLFLFEPGLATPKEIANFTDGLFFEIGNAASITPDGKVIAFAGDRGHGEGVFIAVERSPGKFLIYNVAGENGFKTKPELGFDGSGGPIYFSSIELDSRVGVVYTPDAAGAPNASVVVSFIGTPSAASRANPATGNPLTFTGQRGIWTIRVELDPVGMNGVCVTAGPDGALDSTAESTDTLVSGSVPKYDRIVAGTDGTCETAPAADDDGLFSRTSPIPVVQVGDKIHSGGTTHVVTDVAVNMPLARATSTVSGVSRTERVGDHRVVFWASTAAAQLIVSGEHLDSDQDGLLDHWEEEGIDIDQDGIVDLDLKAMGATPTIRDMFVHIDLTVDRTEPYNVHRLHELMPGVIRHLAGFYASLPALPNGIPAGILLHIDAGTDKDKTGLFFSRNMGVGPLRGGFRHSGAGGTPIDVTYFGMPGSISVAGVTAVSFDTLKHANFSLVHKGARELAFYFITLGDFHHLLGGFNSSGAIDNNATPYIGSVASAGSNFLIDLGFTFGDGAVAGHTLKIVSGTGAGQVRIMSNNIGTKIFVLDPWTIVPDATSKYVMFDGSAGEGHAGFRGDSAFNPGRDLAITLGGYFAIGPLKYQGRFREEWQTLAHEIGHLITLKHGGNNHGNNKPTYWSLMNYLYENCASGMPSSAAGAATCPVDTYSTVLDAIFNDHYHIDNTFAHHLDRIGNAFGIEPDLPDKPGPETMTWKTIELRDGPQDVTAPTLSLTTPAPGATFASGSSIGLGGTAADDTAVVSVEVSFDVNGDGVIDEATEVFAASLSGASFTATLPALSGPNGPRDLFVAAYDAQRNFDVVQRTINVGTTSTVSVPNVVGLTQAAATSAITGAGLVVGTITTQPSGSVPADHVISQLPLAGASVAAGSAVALIVSSGPASVSVPNVVGLTQAAATSAITGAALVVGTITLQPSSSVAADHVISQLPLAGASVAAGSAVALIISTGAAPVSVPDVVGLTQGAATSAISTAGLVVGTITLAPSASVAAGSVISQLPLAGASVAAGTAVNLVVSVGIVTTHVSGATATGTGTATVDLAGGGATCGFTSDEFLPVSGVPGSPGSTPAGVSFPQGLFGFALGPSCTAGGAVSITITYPMAIAPGAHYWKFGPTASTPTPHWYTVPAVFSGATVTFTISDGGTGDDDLAANGIIVDQGGPGVGAAAPTGATVPIPALDRRNVAALALLVVCAGWWTRRRVMRRR